MRDKIQFMYVECEYLVIRNQGQLSPRPRAALVFVFCDSSTVPCLHCERLAACAKLWGVHARSRPGLLRSMASSCLRQPFLESISSVAALDARSRSELDCSTSFSSRASSLLVGPSWSGTSQSGRVFSGSKFLSRFGSMDATPLRSRSKQSRPIRAAVGDQVSSKPINKRFHQEC